MSASPLEALVDQLAIVAGRIEREAGLQIAAALADLRRVDAERELRFSNLERAIEARLASVKDGTPGRDGIDGKDGAPGERGADGMPGRDGVDGKDGAPGERGEKGDKGDLPALKVWTDGVHYARAVVTHEGSTYQAVRDTGRAPPHEDWICIAAAGRNGADGRSFAVRGTFSESAEYQALDVVALGGAAFVARRDAPGACPGDGWQMIASQGKTGKPGDRGGRGERGEVGPRVASMSIDGEGMLTLENADGSTVTCDLYPVLAKLNR